MNISARTRSAASAGTGWSSSSVVSCASRSPSAARTSTSSAADGSIRLQTAGFRDTVRQVDWLLTEAEHAVEPWVFRPDVINLRTLLDAWVTGLARQTHSPVMVEMTAEVCILYGDAALLERFVTNVIRLADQLSAADRRILLRLGHQPLHGFPSLCLDLEAHLAHVHAADFARVDQVDGASPLRGCSFALENCRRILDAHHAAVEFTDLPDSLLRLRVFFPVLSPEQAGQLGPA